MYVNSNHRHEEQQSWSGTHSTPMKIVIIKNAVVNSFTGYSVFINGFPFIRTIGYRTKKTWDSSDDLIYMISLY